MTRQELRTRRGATGTSALYIVDLLPARIDNIETSSSRQGLSRWGPIYRRLGKPIYGVAQQELSDYETELAPGSTGSTCY